MKKSILFIFAVFTMYAQDKAGIDENIDIISKIQGSVASTVEIYYKGDTLGNIIGGAYKSKKNVFNNKNIIEKLEYENDILKEKKLYTYNNKDLLIEKLEYEKNILEERFVYEYNDKNLLIKITEYSPSGQISESIHITHAPLKKIYKFYDDDNSLDETVEVDFNNLGQLIQKKEFDERAVLESYKTYSYNQKGFLEQEKEFYSNGTIDNWTDYTYQYDNNNNWIKKVEIETKTNNRIKDVKIITRTIVYK